MATAYGLEAALSDLAYFPKTQIISSFWHLQITDLKC